MTIDMAMFVFCIPAGLFYWLGMNAKGSDKYSVIYRMFFMSLGFGMLYLSFSSLSILSLGYTVPATPNVPYYSAPSITALSGLGDTGTYVAGIIWVFYLIIEIILYFKNLALMAKQKKEAAWGGK